MAAWDNPSVSVPSTASYAAPLMDFGVLGNLANDYYKGRQNQFDETQRQRELLLQKPINSSDPTAVANELMLRGGSEYAAKLFPFLQQREAGQVSPLLGGPAPQGGGAQPQQGGPQQGGPQQAMPPGAQGPPPGSGGPAPSPVAPQATSSAVTPTIRGSAAPKGDDGVSTLVAVATNRLPEDSAQTGAVIGNIAKTLGVDPNQPLDVAQRARAERLIESYAQRNNIAAPAAQPAAATSAGAPSTAAPLEIPLPTDPATGQPFADPRKAIVALRREGARLSANPYTKEQGKELLDWAKNIETDVTTTRRSQANVDRAFEEKKRLDEATLMQPVKIGTDFSGSDIYAVKDPKSGQYRRIDPKTGLAGAAVASPSEALTAPPSPTPDLPPGEEAGQRYLNEKVPPESHNTIKGLANYEINPTTFSTKGGHRERLIDAASNLAAARGESYDQKEFGARSAAIKGFGPGGKEGTAVRSFDVAIDHLHTLGELAKAMDSGDIRIINAVKNKFKDQFGYDAPSNFDAAKSIVSAEISKAIIGGNSALADREELRAPLSNSKSFGQISGVIDKVYKPLMAGQLNGLKKQYEVTTGRKNFNERISERTRIELGGGSGGAAPQPASGQGGATTAAQPATVATKAEYDALPKGQQYVAPDGQVRTKQ